MPSYVDFESTKKFRDFIIAKTLTVPNGPQTFTSSSYIVQNTSDMANVDPGAVDTNREQDLLQPQTSNVYKPTEYFITEYLETIPRKANLNLYPYFINGNYHSIIGVLTTSDYSTESELMKFAAWNIRENPDGPMYARLEQNLYNATVGRVRLIDALEGNTSTAINIITGKEPLIEKNQKITTAKSLVGKGIDFVQQVAGVEFPWVEIPGDYLSDPKNPTTNFRPTLTSELGRVWQDATGALGSLLGIQRRPTTTKKPSDLFIEYMGEGPKSTLFDNLSYSKYAPDYTTTARSQNTSKLFNYVDQFAEGFKNLLGLEAPKGQAYIGDDRGNDVKYAMGDFNDRPVRSNYYLSLLFDPIQTELFQRKKNIGEGGGIGGKLTWISSKSKNKLGANNEEYASEESQINESLSTNYAFREDSILGLTQQILETLPTDGGASRSHVANVIDQTSRVFREGDVMMSKGSAIKYVDKFSGEESGIEYCRVWTKDRSYMNYSDTMKRTDQLSRKFSSSVLSRPWNLNIYPNSNGNHGFDASSTNIAQGGFNNKTGKFESGYGGFYAKKYMFSIENLAWKSSNRPGFTYNDLPYCERGPNGGRIMWFPPYDLKVNEQNSAKWEDNVFLGRPEPVYTYQNTSRNGSISFKVIVDHPSILNLLVNDHFKGMSDEEADNYINAFFAGCEEVDFYGLIRKYTTLTPVDVKAIQEYLNQNKDPETVKRYITIYDPVVDNTTPTNIPPSGNFSAILKFDNDIPGSKESLYSDRTYQEIYDHYVDTRDQYLDKLNTGLTILTNDGWDSNRRNDYRILSGVDSATKPELTDYSQMITEVNKKINDGFDRLVSQYGNFTSKLSELKDNLSKKTIKDINVTIKSSTSAVADTNYNLKLSYRRSDSVIKDIINKISNGITPTVQWKSSTVSATEKSKGEGPIRIALKDLGYADQDGSFIIDFVNNEGETERSFDNTDCSDVNLPIITELKITAPVTFSCREVQASVSYTTKSPDTPAPSAPVQKPKLVEVTDSPDTGANKVPPIDQMKAIIMKTLSECFYFKKLEEESPLQFSSLREKLRYFHPAFHSMTPEGLNARLTFLHQCVRPGDTIPIKGLSDESDLNARNTTFGPPPILIMRIGDFYHSKVIVRDYNVDFEQNLWDLNPDGIGVQPMIANVTLQVSFIGGHGLEKPVEQLQNALSANFYANTEIYDPRSTATEDRSKYTKEFLEDLMADYKEKQNPDSQEISPTEGKITEGTYIGTLGMTSADPPIKTLSYDGVVDKLFSDVQFYSEHFQLAYNWILKDYGPKVSSMLLSPTYRTINNYEVQTGGGSTDTIEFLGNYKINSELNVLARDFQVKLEDKIQTENISTIFGFNKDLSSGEMDRSERILKPKVKELIGKVIDGIVSNSDVKNVETNRNSIIVSLDKLNFIIGTLHDGKLTIKNNEYSGATLMNFTYDDLYNKYNNAIEFIKENQEKFYEDLDESYVFGRNTTMTANDFSYFLSVLLKGYKSDILSIYKNDSTFAKQLTNIEKRLNKFMASDVSDKNFRIKKYPIRKDTNPITFTIQDESYQFSDSEKKELESVHRTSSNKTTRILNYFR